MTPTALRGAVYALAFTIGSAAVFFNFGTYDPVTGMVTPHPFNLHEAIGVALGMVGGPGMALLAVIRGWGRK